jgi:hypothetical protein
VATIRDVVLIGVILFALSTGVLVIFFASQQVVGQMVLIPAINQSAGTVTVLNATNENMARFDWLLFGAYIGMVLALMITSWYVPGNAIYAFVYMIVAVIAVIVSAFLANMWEAISQATVLSGASASFPIVNHLLTYLPMYTSVVAFIGLVVMFAKPQNEVAS